MHENFAPGEFLELRLRPFHTVLRCICKSPKPSTLNNVAVSVFPLIPHSAPRYITIGLFEGSGG